MIREELPRLRVSRDRAAAEERVAELNRRVAEVNAALPADESIPPLEL